MFRGRMRWIAPIRPVDCAFGWRPIRMTRASQSMEEYMLVEHHEAKHLAGERFGYMIALAVRIGGLEFGE